MPLWRWCRSRCPSRPSGVPDWDPNWSFELECRHVIFGGASHRSRESLLRPPRDPGATPTTRTCPAWQRSVGNAYRRGRTFYKQNVMRYLSEEAAEALFQAKNRLVRRTSAVRDPPAAAGDPADSTAWSSRASSTWATAARTSTT